LQKAITCGKNADRSTVNATRSWRGGNAAGSYSFPKAAVTLN